MSLTSMVIIFDYDGVIVDSSEPARKIFNKFGEKYGTPHVDKNKWRDLFKDNFYELLDEIGFEGNTQKYLKEFVSELEKEEIPFVDGIKDTLKDLEKYPRYIVSSGHSDMIDNKLKKHSISFSDILGADVNTSKVEKLKLIKEKHRGEKMIFITDTSGDILEAREADVPTIAVSWGYHSREHLASFKPDYLVDTPEKIVQIIKNL